MARFASYSSESEISAQAVHQIPWSTIIELMGLSSFKGETLWYVGQITKKNYDYGSWVDFIETEEIKKGLTLSYQSYFN